MFEGKKAGPARVVRRARPIRMRLAGWTSGGKIAGATASAASLFLAFVLLTHLEWARAAFRRVRHEKARRRPAAERRGPWPAAARHDRGGVAAEPRWVGSCRASVGGRRRGGRRRDGC